MSGLQSRLAYLQWKSNGGDPETLLKEVASAHVERLQEATQRGSKLIAQQFKLMQGQTGKILELMQSFNGMGSLESRVSSLKDHALSLEERECAISQAQEEMRSALEKTQKKIADLMHTLTELQAPPPLSLAEKGILVFLHVYLSSE